MHSQKIEQANGSWSFECTCGYVSAGNAFSSLDFWLNEHRDMHYYESVNS